LQYVPWDLSCEKDILNHTAGPVLSFATQKFSDLQLVSKASTASSILGPLDAAWKTYSSKIASEASVAKRMKTLTESDFSRPEPFKVRRPKQLPGVPLLPTTTIGSFPQTRGIRQLRSQKKKGILSEADYNAAIDQQISFSIGNQEGLGLDILVHGEAERTYMVEHFAQQMDAMLFTQTGWVQSFGSRCVRPPIIWSDVFRPTAMTVCEFSVAQGLTKKPSRVCSLDPSLS
jgi:5-methyltetrahydropteroyltriglutamate--homocysteine methyltransferase